MVETLRRDRKLLLSGASAAPVSPVLFCTFRSLLCHFLFIYRNNAIIEYEVGFLNLVCSVPSHSFELFFFFPRCTELMLFNCIFSFLLYLHSLGCTQQCSNFTCQQQQQQQQHEPLGKLSRGFHGQFCCCCC